MLIKVSRNLLVESFVALVDVADVLLLEFDLLSFVLLLLLDSSPHFVGQVPGSLAFPGLIRGGEDGIKGPETFPAGGGGLQGSSSRPNERLEISFVVAVLALGIVIIVHFELVGLGFGLLLVGLFL